ncbi:hypothetical protein [Streptomyces sp. enrichment culture]|uniref:hypothetical protein n=1 Tax=Streptomyces sp. enrichment culture TaxID=1795815 RepID=UPI003F54DC64
MALARLTALSRQYECLWPEVTEGYSGKVSFWHWFIRKQQNEPQPRRRGSP